MALPGSGTIKLSDVATEFGGSLPHAMSEYYRGGSYVPDTAGNAGVPTSGSISLSDFYGATAAVAIFSGSKKGDSTSYWYVRTSDWTDTNGAVWQILKFNTGDYANKTHVRITSNRAQTYWSYITWAPSTTVNRTSAEAFIPWDGSYTIWQFDGDAFDIFDHMTGIDTAFVIYG